MKLYNKLIQHFLKFQELVSHETVEILHPILVEVEQQGEEVLLFPPVRGTLWTEWLVKPSEGIPTESYRHLLLMVYLAPFSELNLVLVERYERKPNELDREIFKEHYRAGRLLYDLPPFSKVMEWKATGEEERNKGSYSDYGLDELARFPLKRKINAKMIAERIVSEAQKIHGEQTPVAKECGKER